MGRHYHLLIETPEPNLVEGMKWVQNTYTRRFNVRHRAWGRVFGDRDKAVPAALDARMSHLRRGWYWGSEVFAERLRAMLKLKLNEPKSRACLRSPQRLAHGMQRAEELADEGLWVAGLQEKELGGLNGSNPRRVELARVIRRDTTASLGWIARRLEMKSAANAGQ